jgi:putative ABC transport system permease protein
VPARQAALLQPSQALKGLGSFTAAPPRALPGVLLCAAGTALAFLPPVGGLPLAAYAAVAAWLFGGVALVPWAVDGLLRLVPPPHGAVPRLAVERARHQRAAATAAVAGVVASLALCVALTVMVSSFRDGVVRWLDQVLPADLYARTGQTSAQADTLRFPPALLETLRAHPDVARVQVARSRALPLQPQLPAVTLFARELDDPAAALPLLERPLPPTPGTWGVYVSEAMVTLHGARVGGPLVLPLGPGGQPVETRVLGVWRDYARQFGTVAMPLPDYQRLTGDERLNDVALWLRPGARPDAVQQLLRDAAQGSGLDFASAAELRQLSLRIFDRSFAVTRYLQVVAIAIGIIGVGASLSAQVLARRKEFGLLVHLGFTPRQLLAMVCAEVGTWLLAGAAVGLALGTVISVVLVHVVNPQSFHWTMELVWPAGRLLALCGAVLLAGLLTTAFTARKAAGAPAVQAVKEDW